MSLSSTDMSNPFSRILETSRARHTNMRRIVWSTCLSVALHAGLLALPSGGAVWGVMRSTPARLFMSGGKGAPLSITLAPTPLQLANAPTTQHDRPPSQPSHLSQTPQPIPKAETNSGTAEITAETAQTETYNDFGLPIPDYHEPHELSQHAEVPEDIDLNLPEINAFHGAGQAILTIYVDETGGIDRIEIGDSTIDSILANALAQQFTKGTFQPAKIDGVAVKSRVKIEILVRP